MKYMIISIISFAVSISSCLANVQNHDASITIPHTPYSRSNTYLYHSCVSPVDHKVCTAYISGIAEMMAQNGAESHRMNVLLPYSICIPPNIGEENTVNVFVDWYRHNGNATNMYDMEFHGVTQALFSRWSCAK